MPSDPPGGSLDHKPPGSDYSNTPRKGKCGDDELGVSQEAAPV